MSYWIDKNVKLKALQAARDGLAEALTGKIYDRELGLCTQVFRAGQAVGIGGDVMDYVVNFLGREWRKWPHFSGNKLHPVPDPDYKGTNLEIRHRAAAVAYGRSDLWVEEYGELRKDLARFLIERLDAEIVSVRETT